jgi:phage-related protein
MDKKWKVVMYKSSSGDYPVRQFIDSLEIKTQAKVHNTVKLLQEFGILLGLPHVKKLTGTDLWELRILGRNNLRVLYIAVTGRTFILLHGFKKKKDKIRQKEIKIAECRLTEYRLRTTK